MVTWSERRLIEKIRQASQKKSEGLLKTIGDDCCEVVFPGSFLISTDTLVDSVHFDISFHPPHLLGRKAIAVNLSDIAAMGGRPRFALLSLCLPEHIEWDWISTWLNGALEILREYDCVLIGGDTVKGKSLVFTVTVIGEPVAPGSVYRNGAKEGDSVWVSGPLGSAGGGLEILQYNKIHSELLDVSSWKKLLSAHLDPVPCIDIGMDLAQSGLISAMLDVSDGLATDLAHLCLASGVSAVIRTGQLPYLPELSSVAEALNRNLEDLILRSGEDYQLVFTVKGGREEEVIRLMSEKGRDIYQIGEIRSGQGVILESDTGAADISFQGYEH